MFAISLVPQLDVMPRVLHLVRTALGRLALVAAFTALLAALKVPAWWQTGLFLAVTSLFPEHRKSLLAAAAILWIYLSPPIPLDAPWLKNMLRQHAAERFLPIWPAVVFLVWLLAISYAWLCRAFPKSPCGQRPVLVLVLILLALLSASNLPLAGLPWFLIAASAIVLTSYLWFFAYWLSENAARKTAPFQVSVSYWRPLWQFNAITPFGKGAAYLDRVEAKDDQQLASVQLKGLKLLLWATALTFVLVVANRLAYGPSASLTAIPLFAPHARIPTYAMALEAQLQGHPYPFHLRWLALILHFLFFILTLTVFGHKIIAICRMAGFNVFRNTYRPFGSTTIAEFYNRIFYYFKELLVVFFFYPTYLRYFKKYPRLRLFSATVAAAGLGNFLCHFLRDGRNIIQMGLARALLFYHVYAVYALILGVAIGLSQLRQKARKGREPTGHRKLLAIASVFLFYCLITILDEPDATHPHTIVDYGHYFLSLFRP